MPETSGNTPKEILGLFRSDNVNATYHKALSSLRMFLASCNSTPEFPAEAVLTDWFVNMNLRGLSPKTAMLYLDAVGAMYNTAVREGRASACDAFRKTKAGIRNLDNSDTTITPEAFRRLTDLTKSVANKSHSTGADILLMALLNPAMTLRSVIRLTKTEAGTLGEESRRIADRHIVPQRKYVFDLAQSQRTPRQLDQYAEKLISGWLLRNNLPLVGDVNRTLDAYRALAAIRCGLSPGRITAYLGHRPEALPLLNLCPQEEISQEQREQTQAATTRLFVADPLRWYAMRLRPQVTFADILVRFSRLSGEITEPQFFYPCDEIARKTGHKIEHQKRPVISDVVFFRSALTDILPMFGRIGDLAWCYTTTGRPGAPYAAIPQQNFDRFQEAIGHFTPEYHIAPAGTFEPAEGETVVILGGLFGGRQIDLTRVEGTDSANTIYRLNFESNNGIEWRIGVDKRLISKK